MKKRLFLLFTLTSISLFSQKNIALHVQELIENQASFQSFSIVTPILNPVNSTIDRAVNGASLVKINTNLIHTIVQKKYQNIALEIPYQNQLISVLLYSFNPFESGFHVDTSDSKNTVYQSGIYYRGIIKGDSNSLVSFSFFNNECYGIISSDRWSNLVISKLDIKQNLSDYIIYKDSDLKIQSGFKCNLKEIPTSRKYNIQKNATSSRCVTTYFEIENDLFQANNNDITATTNWMTAVFNNVQTIYANDGILISLKSIYIWTNPDPYTGTSSSDYLYQFHDLRPVFDGDVGQLVGLDSGGLGGVAVTVNGLCSNNNFSYSDVYFSYNTVPTYSWTINVITHELGHLLGSPHTHGCYWNGDNTAIDGCGQQAGYIEGNCPTGPIPYGIGGTIMSYCHVISGAGVNFNNGFGTQPASLIQNTINDAPCLSTDCITTCINTISSVSSSNITDTSAIIKWTEIGGTTTSEVSVFPLSSGTGIWNTQTNNQFLATNLLPNTYYKAIVRNQCQAGLMGPEIGILFVTSGDFCSGIPLTDSGGASGDYMDFENITRTIIPTDPNAKAKITFSSFDLENNYDFFYVYNGENTSFPDLSAGGFTGNTIPNPIESTANNGALTLKFVADGGVVASGYDATISCSTLGNTTFSGIDFSYFPNPTQDYILIHSKTEMSQILVYNLEGRLLLNQKVDGLETKVNLIPFAQGTYFFKLKWENQEVNFKVLKI